MTILSAMNPATRVSKKTLLTARKLAAKHQLKMPAVFGVAVDALASMPDGERSNAIARHIVGSKKQAASV